MTGRRAGDRLQMAPLPQWPDGHTRVVADQSAQIVGIAGDYYRRAGAECGSRNVGVHRVAGIESISAQQVSSSGRDRAVDGASAARASLSKTASTAPQDPMARCFGQLELSGQVRWLGGLHPTHEYGQLLHRSPSCPRQVARAAQPVRRATRATAPDRARAVVLRLRTRSARAARCGLRLAQAAPYPRSLRIRPCPQQLSHNYPISAGGDSATA